MLPLASPAQQGPGMPIGLGGLGCLGNPEKPSDPLHLCYWGSCGSNVIGMLTCSVFSMRPMESNSFSEIYGSQAICVLVTRCSWRPLGSWTARVSLMAFDDVRIVWLCAPASSLSLRGPHRPGVLWESAGPGAPEGPAGEVFLYHYFLWLV